MARPRGTHQTQFPWGEIEVDPDTGCWLMPHRTKRSPQGYIRIRMHGRLTVAHRAAYEEVFGPVPKGFVLDHTCSVPGCVRPHHMEPVSHGENIRRGGLPHDPETFPCGHPRSPDNTQRFKDDNRIGRRCLTCHRARKRKHGSG